MLQVTGICFYLVLATLVAQPSFVLGSNACVPPPQINPNNLYFTELMRDEQSYVDGLGYAYHLQPCSTVGKCPDGTKGMMLQEKGSQCFSLGTVIDNVATWYVDQTTQNFVFDTSQMSGGSTQGCGTTGRGRRILLEFVCDLDAIDKTSRVLKVTPPAEGETFCGTYKATLTTCLACKVSKFGKCHQAPPPITTRPPRPIPTTTPSPSKSPKDSVLPYVIIAVVVVVIVMGYFVYTKHRAGANGGNENAQVNRNGYSTFE